MNSPTEFALRLRKVINEDFQGNVRGFARKCVEVAREEAPSVSLIRKYLGSTWPRLDKLLVIAKATGRSIAYFTELENAKPAPQPYSRKLLEAARLQAHFASSYADGVDLPSLVDEIKQNILFLGKVSARRSLPIPSEIKEALLSRINELEAYYTLAPTRIDVHTGMGRWFSSEIVFYDHGGKSIGSLSLSPANLATFLTLLQHLELAPSGVSTEKLLTPLSTARYQCVSLLFRGMEMTSWVDMKDVSNAISRLNKQFEKSHLASRYLSIEGHRNPQGTFYRLKNKVLLPINLFSYHQSSFKSKDLNWNRLFPNYPIKIY